MNHFKKLLKYLFVISLSMQIGIFAYAKNIYDPMSVEYLHTIIQKLENGHKIIFTKFGDGEYFCMTNNKGTNIDGDRFNPWLSQALKKAFISLCKKPNVYIGKWLWFPEPANFCNDLARQHGVKIPWVHYHMIMNDDEFLKYDYMYRLVEFIVHSPKKKILLCNHMNKRLKDFFRANVYIELPAQNWSYEYTKWRDILEKEVENNCIILICGGMCSKVLIDEITTKYDVTFIDLGSSFDILGGRRNTRGHKHSYEDEVRYYRDLIS